MEAPHAGIAHQTLVAAGAEDSGTARHVQSGVDHLPGCLDRVIFRRENLRGPLAAVIHPLRPVLRDTLEVRADGFELDHHVGYGVLDFRVMSHRSAEPQRAFALRRYDRVIESPPREPVIHVTE